jgi:hypothetical protein
MLSPFFQFFTNNPMSKFRTLRAYCILAASSFISNVQAIITVPDIYLDIFSSPKFQVSFGEILASDLINIKQVS